MDENLNLVVSWFGRLGINNLDLTKLKRQLSIIDNWFKNNCRAAFLAITGFGKTYVAFITIYRLNLKYRDAIVIVVVPTINLKEQWENQIDFFGLRNVIVKVANGYASEYLEKRKTIRGYKHKCNLLILDEIHNYISENGKVLNQVIDGTECDMLLGMSATLDDTEQEILRSFNIPICDEVTLSEARKNHYIAEYQIYNYGIELNELDRENYNKVNDIHNSNYAKFRWFPESNLNYELARACCAGNNTTAKVGQEIRTGAQWRLWYAQQQNWDGQDNEAFWSPKNINKYAQQWNWAMKERKNMINNHELKLSTAVNIINFLELKTITFSENTAFADKLTEKLGNKAKSYHTNIGGGEDIEYKTEVRKSYTSAKSLRLRTHGILSTDNSTNKPIYSVTYEKRKKVSQKVILSRTKAQFSNDVFPVLNTVTAFNEGGDIPSIRCAIICAANSVRRATLQRMGRTLRYIEGKKSYIFNLYFINTQDESWLNKRQKGDSGIKWIKSINEIEL